MDFVSIMKKLTKSKEENLLNEFNLAECKIFISSAKAKLPEFFEKVIKSKSVIPKLINIIDIFNALSVEEQEICLEKFDIFMLKPKKSAKTADLLPLSVSV